MRGRKRCKWADGWGWKREGWRHWMAFCVLHLFEDTNFYKNYAFEPVWRGVLGCELDEERCKYEARVVSTRFEHL